MDSFFYCKFGRPFKLSLFCVFLFFDLFPIFIGPRSDHSLPMSLTDSLTDSLTHSLTDSRLVKLIGMNLVCENGNSKLSQLVSLPTLVSNKLTNCCLIDFDRL